MRCFEFMFIRRNWPVDQKYLAACMERLSKDLEPVWLLIFPEGTVFAHDTKSKSMDFAQKNGLVRAAVILFLYRALLITILDRPLRITCCYRVQPG